VPVNERKAKDVRVQSWDAVLEGIRNDKFRVVGPTAAACIGQTWEINAAHDVKIPARKLSVPQVHEVAVGQHRDDKFVVGPPSIVAIASPLVAMEQTQARHVGPLTVVSEDSQVKGSSTGNKFAVAGGKAVINALGDAKRRVRGGPPSTGESPYAVGAMPKDPHGKYSIKS